MSKSDDDLRALFQKHLPRLRGFMWTVVETGGTHNGVPDSYWVHEPTAQQGWIESKATDGWAVEVRPHQVSWIDPRVRAGVRVVVAIRARGKGSSDGHGDSLWLVDGRGIKELQEFGLKLPQEFIIGKWMGNPKAWSWEKIEVLLTSAG